MAYLYHKVSDTVKKYDLIDRDDRVLVAVSGGPDSVALFRFLFEYASEVGLTIQIFHLNHQIRDEAISDEMFVRELGKEFDTKVHVLKYDVKEFARHNGLSLQEGAREIRYKSMEEVARVNDLNKIATGHIIDDVTETFLMRVANGSGFRGLAGIPPKRDGKFIRPLIECTKNEITSWIDEIGQGYVIDESNNSDKYYRNRIRSHVTSHLKDEGIDDVIFKTCEIIRDEENHRERKAKAVFLEIASSDPMEISIPISGLSNEPMDIQTRILRMCVEKQSRPYADKPTIKQLENALLKLYTGDLSSLDLSGGISLCREDDRVVLYERGRDGSVMENELVIGRDNSISLLFNIRIELIDVRNLELESGADIAFADEGKIKWPLKVRSFKPGDRFSPFGMKGSKKVKDYFIDEKISKRRRGHIPIIVDREKIVWIAGYRSDERVKVDGSTGKVAVLKIETRE